MSAAHRPPHYADFAAALAAAVPPGQCLLGTAAIAAWVETTHAVHATPCAVAVPANVAELQGALAAARAFGVDVKAISAGRNIGLGGRLPPLAAGAPLLLDMRLFRTIRAVDERFGTIVVEAGVTFQDVHAALRARGSRWFLPATGGPPDGSVVGNLLQRGDGTGPYGDRVRAFLDLEAVLPGGERISTRRDAAGPDLSGLLFQSDAAVITAASLSLAPLPRVMTRFVLRLRPGGSLAALVDAAAAATQDGVLLPGAACIWNGTKRLIRDGVGEASSGWVLSGALHAASQRRAEADWLDLMDAFAAADPEIVLHETVAAPQGQGLLEGEPNDLNLVSVASGLQSPGGRPGFAWLCPMLPFDGAAVEAVMRIVEQELGAAGVPPNLAVGCRDMRTARGYVAIAWDRADPAAEARAMAAHDRLLARLDRAGLPPYRLGQLSQDWTQAARDDTPAVLARLLAALGS